MTKKRFTWDNLGEVDAIADGDTFRWYLHMQGMDDLVEFMNEQEALVNNLKKEVNQLSHENKRLLTIVNNYRSKYE